VPPNRRRALHARIAAAIEEVYAGRVVEHVERLAHHSVKAELWESAAGHLRQAGTKAARRHALREALDWFAQALSALSHVAPSRVTLETAVDIRFERMRHVNVTGRLSSGAGASPRSRGSPRSSWGMSFAAVTSTA